MKISGSKGNCTYCKNGCDENAENIIPHQVHQTVAHDLFLVLLNAKLFLVKL